MNKDQATGRLKKATGELLDDDDLKREGQRDEAVGKAKDILDKVADKSRDAIDAARRKLEKD